MSLNESKKKKKKPFLKGKIIFLEGCSVQFTRYSHSTCVKQEMTSLINHLLAHHLANNESATFNSKYVLGVLQTERAIAKCEAEEGSSGPVMHR